MKQLLLVGLIVSILLALQIARVENPLWPGTAYYAQPWEHHDYHAMADGGSGRAPYVYRVLTPWLASLFTDRVIGFQIIAILALWATAMMLYVLLRTFYFSIPFALFGLLLFFSLQWVVRFTLWDFWLPDPISFLLIVTGIWAIKTQNLAVFAGCMVIGALNKESIWAIAPLAFTMGKRSWLLALIPALIVTVGLRLVIHPIPDDYSMLGLLRWRLETFDPSLVSRITIGTFGILFVLPFLSRRNLNHLKVFAPFLVLCYAQLLVANTDERLVALAFPVFIVMSLTAVHGLWSATKLSLYIKEKRQ